MSLFTFGWSQHQPELCYIPTSTATITNPLMICLYNWRLPLHMQSCTCIVLLNT